ncbi:MAG: LysR family transcriptional regulator ArgP [Neisseriaceae bacterium]|nr:LysR family transcriptional regulator ArgP [Neisseriaceae bacterium]MBP6861168.1 LysR family transcriptional regulator ArgP [Neisseriaceae bacterium]
MMSMTFNPKHTEALLAVADQGSFEAAATTLNLTTSAISQRIKALESEMGAVLVIRARPCRLTKEGHLLAQYLRRARMLADEFSADYQQQQANLVSMTIAANNDSLSTWLLPVLAEFMQQEPSLWHLRLHDQAVTHKALEEGHVIAAITDKGQAMRGCSVAYLGAIRYRLLAAPDFYQRWFQDGINRASLKQAPLLVFDHLDKLQDQFLQQQFGLRQEACPRHYIPSSVAFYQAVELSMGYGMIPELQYQNAVNDGALIDLMPGCYIDVPLYWHYWQVHSAKVARLTAFLVARAQQVLQP